MIFTDREIQLAIAKGQIGIEPEPALDAYSSTSVDLRLADRITVFKKELNTTAVKTEIDPVLGFQAETAIKEISDETPIGPDGYLLIPRCLVLGWTLELVTLPTQSRLAARVEGKSSLARLGLGVHITAPTIHSGFENLIRLEMVNHGAVPIRLRAGMKICQLVFELTLGTSQKAFSAIQTA